MNEYILKKVLADTAAERYAEYGENEVKHTFSVGYRIKRSMLILKTKRGTTNRVTRVIPVLRLNIIIIVTIITILAVSAFVVWYHISGFGFKVEPTNSTVYVESVQTPKTKIEEIYYIPDSEGVEMIRQNITSGAVLTKYKLGENQIILNQTLIIDIHQINTEGYLIESVQIGDNNGYFIQMDDNSFVSWTMGGYLFSITGNLDKDSTLHLAKMTIC